MEILCEPGRLSMTVLGNEHFLSFAKTFISHAKLIDDEGELCIVRPSTLLDVDCLHASHQNAAVSVVAQCVMLPDEAIYTMSAIEV